MPLLTAVIKRQATPVRLKKYTQKLLDAFPGYGQPAAPQAADEMAGLL